MFVVIHRIYNSDDPIVDIAGPFETREEAVKASQEKATAEYAGLDLSVEDGVFLVLEEYRGIGIVAGGLHEQDWEVRELHN